MPTKEGLTPEDIAILSQPFPFEAYQFYDGFTYIKRDYVSDRLTSVDPSYEFYPVQVYSRDRVAVARCIMRVKGVTRGDVGMATIEYTKKDPTREATEAEKSAVTDGLKRCGWQFYIARELRLAPKVYINPDTKRPYPKQLQAFKNWHMELTGEVVTLTYEEAADLANWYRSDEIGLTDADALKILKVDRFSEYVGGFDEAKADIERWLKAKANGRRKK